MSQSTLPSPMVTDGDNPRTRRADPVTSHQAADGNDIHGSAEYVMDLLRFFGPMADHELVQRAENEGFLYGAHVVRYTPQRLRTARHELVTAGLVVDAGYCHLTESNRKATVWSVTA